jgi:hypothetical protein
LKWFLRVFFGNLIFTLAMGLFFDASLALNANSFRIYQQTYTGTNYESTQNF